jgi:hypothetical protein
MNKLRAVYLIALQRPSVVVVLHDSLNIWPNVAPSGGLFTLYTFDGPPSHQLLLSHVRLHLLCRVGIGVVGRLRILRRWLRVGWLLRVGRLLVGVLLMVRRIGWYNHNRALFTIQSIHPSIHPSVNQSANL